ncbi:stage V sporulation protein AA [Clostridium sp.]|uniref:stage V sporulation protein AA n=1 Tax=Clostridium sp. TaxID=1506 RepID=UPI003079ED87
MTQTVYLKLSQITQVHEKNVPLASLGEVYCSEKSVESRCRAMIVKRIRGGGKQRESRLVGNVMEIIQQIEREIPGTSVQNLGETDWQWCKTLFVCLICFFGAAFAIMTFNNDANVLDVFRKIYEITTGQASDGTTALEVGYSIGLPVGILLFFNHFTSWKFSLDPTPLEVEMRLYEENVNKTLIQNEERKEDDIDVS